MQYRRGTETILGRGTHPFHGRWIRRSLAFRAIPHSSSYLHKFQPGATPNAGLISWGMRAALLYPPRPLAPAGLANAASVAGLMLTTEVTVTDLPEEKKKPPSGMGGMM